MTGYFDKKCYHEDTYGDCYTECVFCKMSNGRQYEDEPSMSEDPHPYCGIYIESFPKPCKYHRTADELKKLIDSGVSDRLINIDAVFTYLDEMEANLGDIHCDITNNVLIRSKARDAQTQYWITGRILEEYLKLIGMWE